MEKLIELLNKYQLEECGQCYWVLDKRGKLYCQSPTGESMEQMEPDFIILKGFIKWLVDNDKIDLGKLIMIKDEEQKAIVDIDNSRENTLLMLLAISDTPIDDLISYLK